MSAGTYISSSFLFINLGCQMMYILINRLKAQKISHEKSSKIICDITNTVFKQQFIKQLMLPQLCLKINYLKDIFKKLVHSSIMKLDPDSMQKLFFLMLMSFKKQIFLTSSPLQLYTLTINHIQSLRVFIDSMETKVLLENILDIFKQTASKYTFMQYFMIKQQIISIFEVYQTKIVTFITNGLQNQKGQLIFYPRNQHQNKSLGSGFNHKNLEFPVFKEFKKLQHLEYKDFCFWKTLIGTNLYQQQTTQKNSPKKQKQKIAENSAYIPSNDNKLKDVLGIKSQDVQNFAFTLDLFGGGVSQLKQSNISKKHQITTKKSSKVESSNIAQKINKQFDQLNSQSKQNDEIDLLDMMDNQ